VLSLSLASSSTLRFLVSGNSLGKAKSQRLQNAHKPPNMAKPSHQFPTHRLSSGVSEVWTPNSTNFERKIGLKTNPAAAPERNDWQIHSSLHQELWLSCLSRIYVKRKEKSVLVNLQTCARDKIQPQWPVWPVLISGSRRMKRLGVFIVPPGWDTSPSQGYPQH